MADLKRFQAKIAKAREKQRYKSRKKQEAKTVHAVASTRRQEIDLQRKADLTKRRTEASTKQAIAEEQLASQKAAATVALKKKRAAKRQRVMSERELRREQLRPVLEAPGKIIRSVRAVPAAFQRIQKALPKGSAVNTSTTASRGTPQDPFPGVRQWLNDVDKKMKQ